MTSFTSSFSPYASRLAVPFLGALTALAFSCSSVSAQTPAPATATNSDLLRGLGGFERSYTATPPWAGVDSNNFLRGSQETAPIVLSNGQVEQVSIPTSIGVADLNGDKLPDLIVADPSGLVWFYPNSGTATEPKFTFGEIIPIWLRGMLLTEGGEQRSIGCNKIVATDFNDDGKIDLIFGTFVGEVYFVPNTGSSTNPRFTVVEGSKENIVNTRSDGKLWGTFFAPIYVDFTKSNRKDLILGEGTYSANNIYYFPNAGSGQSPKFSEKTRQILIAGMGREHLTPQMVDWNNDGIPDIITGERDGSVTVFICKSNDPKKFVFAPDPIPVKFGSSSKLGSLSNPVPADINGDGLFDIVVGKTNGRVAIALNKGKAGAPQFDMPVEVPGVQPYTKYLSPTGWTLDAPPQSLFHVFHLVTGQDPSTLTGAEKDRATLAYQAGFSTPPDGKGKYAAVLDFLPNKAKLFTGQIPLPPEAVYTIKYDGGLTLKADTNYEFTAYVRGSGWQKTSMSIIGGERFTVADSKTNEKKYKYVNYGKDEDITAGSSWSKITKSFRYSRDKAVPEKEKATPLSFGIAFKLTGKGTSFYLDDITVVEKK